MSTFSTDSIHHVLIRIIVRMTMGNMSITWFISTTMDILFWNRPHLDSSHDLGLMSLFDKMAAFNDSSIHIATSYGGSSNMFDSAMLREAQSLSSLYVYNVTTAKTAK